MGNRSHGTHGTYGTVVGNESRGRNVVNKRESLGCPVGRKLGFWLVNGLFHLLIKGSLVEKLPSYKNLKIHHGQLTSYLELFGVLRIFQITGQLEIILGCPGKEVIGSTVIGSMG